MKIIRDGKEFQLTASELQQAFEEQQLFNDMGIIEENMSRYLSNDEAGVLEENPELLKEAARIFRKRMDDIDILDMLSEFPLAAALDDIKEKRLKPSIDEKIAAAQIKSENKKEEHRDHRAQTCTSFER